MSWKLHVVQLLALPHDLTNQSISLRRALVILLNLWDDLRVSGLLQLLFGLS